MYLYFFVQKAKFYKYPPLSIAIMRYMVYIE